MGTKPNFAGLWTQGIDMACSASPRPVYAACVTPRSWRARRCSEQILRTRDSSYLRGRCAVRSSRGSQEDARRDCGTASRILGLTRAPGPDWMRQAWIALALERKAIQFVSKTTQGLG